MSKNLVHAVADCLDCDQHWGYFMTARSLAKAHVKKTGHTVSVETGYAFKYTGRKRESLLSSPEEREREK